MYDKEPPLSEDEEAEIAAMFRDIPTQQKGRSELLEFMKTLERKRRRLERELKATVNLMPKKSG